MTEKILLDRLFPRLSRDAQTSRPTELLCLSYALSLDLLNCFIFGLSSGPNFTQDDLLTQAFLEHYENRYCEEGFWPQELPFLTSTLGMLGIDMLPRRHYDSTVWIENWMMIHCNRAHRVCELADEGELPDDPADIPIVYQQIKKSMEALKGGEGHNRPYIEKQMRLSIASELFDHMCKYTGLLSPSTSECSSPWRLARHTPLVPIKHSRGSAGVNNGRKESNSQS
jgi:hypothetical protein